MKSKEYQIEVAANQKQQAKTAERRGKSSIEADRKNLHNVFGIPLKSHWVFRGVNDHT